MRPPQLVTQSGAKLMLGAMLGQGGEGAVWEIASQPDRVAKVYHKPLAPERAEKIRLMSQVGGDALRQLTAWPIELVHQPGLGPIGLLMPKISGRKDIHALYSPKSRRSEFQRADWRFLIRVAANAARAFAAVHQSGAVIGDVNHGSILVGQDATVRLIDCDSFQVVAGGRRFLCEVGVETFTPPELQGRPFAGVVRTQNHDNFGLGVMIFLLLFMGRHPFAGRYAGQGDMPISRAIEEVRFPYGTRHADVGMTRPPGTPSLGIVGPQVEFLFERAFAREMIPGGRPDAREWIETLGAFEKELVNCRSNPAHWHHRSIPCPWCPMEGATGVQLFGVIQGAQAGGTLFDLSAFWRQVDAIRDPGAAPTISSPPAKPSANATSIKRLGATRWFVAAFAAGFLVFVGANAKQSVFYWLALAAFVGAVLLMRNTKGRAEIEQAFRDAQRRWTLAGNDWEERAGNGQFFMRRSQLNNLRVDWEGLPQRRLALLDQLRRDQRQLQLNRYLDNFEIAHARIDGVGAGKKQILESYNIETALDITQTNVLAVPGFGPKTFDKLRLWRQSLERRFVFDPAKAIDPRDIHKIEGDILAQKRSLEGKMQTALNELRQSQAQVTAARQHLRPAVEAAHVAYLQAQADTQAIK